MEAGAQRHVFLGIAVGVTGGVLARFFLPEAARAFAVESVATPVGQIFLRLLFMLAVPVVFSALVVGIADLDLKSLGRIGLRTLGLTVLASATAVALGLFLVEVVAPGEGQGDLRQLAEKLAQGKPVPAAATSSGAIQLVQMIPDNPIKAAATGDMLGLIVFALCFGVALGQVRTDSARALQRGITGLFEVTMYLLEQVLRLAPVGVGALLFVTTASVGVDVLGSIAAYVGVVVGAIVLHMAVTYPVMLRVFARRSVLEFYRGVRLPMQTAFATSSSSATLPVSLEAADKELRLPRSVAQFVLTAGASMNQNGTALFEGITVLFLAQLFDVDLSLAQQLQVMLICILGGIGTAGIPGASLPVIAMILTMLGVPPEGLALIIGVDRLLDMCRTTLNVVGDLVIAACVAGPEGSVHEPSPPE
ncbi:MAG TPA: dicarboxylate/amino acid:cation symporter [Polyangiaceae bacterium]|nr:dicarboxylate/amino acid:cation symporter [Polyangiaceae bacterium]